MTAKEYLGQIRKLEAGVKSRIKELQRVQQENTYMTGIQYDTIRVQTSTVSTGFPEMERRADLELEIEKRIRELADRRHTIIGQIEALPNPVHVQLLLERYVHYHRFEEIVDIMGYSYPHTIRLHGEALMAFTKKYDIK